MTEEKNIKSSTFQSLRLGNIYNQSYGGSYDGTVYNTNGLCPVLMTAQGGMVPIIPVLSKGDRDDSNR